MTAIYADPRKLVARMLRRTVRADTGCWIWTGGTTSGGYGCVGSGIKGKNVLTHRLMVIARDGGIPDGMTVDHICHDSYTCTEKPCPHRRCVNPDHLAVVTLAENVARQWDGDTCRQGHKLSLRADGKRRCRTCASKFAAEWKARRAA